MLTSRLARISSQVPRRDGAGGRVAPQRTSEGMCRGAAEHVDVVLEEQI